ncbi:Tyrosine-protein kinase [Quillaja saponaria]|uniref:non-specific serine/threonine protein kinase n=1 Tax=Quillaja saponaria TaxID=32244 RepID=A0AAD7PFK6_QUISA|nr:Tyrosine-protein kinase [Quillaja saponaria]
MDMKNLWASFYFLFLAFILVLVNPISIAQLTPSETRILFQVQKLLEYPEALQGWTDWTNFCYLPPSPSLKIVCSNSRVTELTVTGNKSSPSHSSKPASWNSTPSQQTLSKGFSIDAFFTVLTKLSNLEVLSLVSLGLWGPLPAKMNRFWSLQVLNISSNFIYGEIPSSISSMKNIRSLVLADNLFNGSVPDLKTLTSLEELNLGNNHLGPGFPSMGNNLVSIILRNNSLRSEIPSKLTNFEKVQKFDISSNNIVGFIPSSLFSLPSIQYLNLAENQLSGSLTINMTCSDVLQFVDISRNHLTGKLPSCIGLKKPSNRTVLYPWNCLSSGNLNYQHPYSDCQKEALAVKPPTERHKQESSTKLGLILGIIGGIVGITLLLVVLVLVIVRKSKVNRAEDNKFEGSFADKVSLRGSPRPNNDARHVPPTVRLPALGLPPYRIFTLEEIEDATKNFEPSNLMSEGSQGQLYKGWLENGSVVLVNCVKLKQKNMPPSFMHHMEVLPKLRHRHLVSVLGHCIVTYQDHPNTATSTTVFFVIEYIFNGSLRDHLADWKKKEMLKWPQRMAITIGIARGVQFLHSGVAPGIFGNNFKIENILLDDSLNAKIGGYNILNATDHLGGTENAEKEDIYQLGVILLEIITGRQITSASELEDLKLELERGLSESASVLRGATDSSVRGTYAYESLKTMVQITINCLCSECSKRPSIEDVLWNLQYSIQVQEGWGSSGNLSTRMRVWIWVTEQ